MTDPDVPQPIVRDKDPKSFYAGTRPLASGFEFHELSPDAQPAIASMSSADIEGALKDDAARRVNADATIEKKVGASTMPTHEREVLEKQLEVIARTMAEIADANDVKNAPGCWANVCQATNIALGVALKISMAEIAAMLRVDVEWLAGLPALMAKRSNAVTAKSPTGHEDVARATAPAVDNRPFVAGDVVMLNSGGARMTIESVTADGDGYNLAWFTDAADVRRMTVPMAAVHRA
jgi:uncharacterized protein YodC (DUF2158 family)